jgi:ferredoxin-NADP reductase
MELTARLTSIRHSTPTVKTFTFFVSRGFTFLPGQWIDLWIEPPDEEPLIGGFTLVSSPSQSEYIELAIKGTGDGRAASFMHIKAKLGDLFHLEGPSGTFYFLLQRKKEWPTPSCSLLGE